MEIEVNLQDVKLQNEEVQNVKWVSKEEILTMIESNAFKPYYQGLIHLLFDSRNNMDV